MKILVLARATDPHRQSEALRAALGLTLRGATVTTFVDAPLDTPLAERAAATLRSFGHPVEATGITTGLALAEADAIEVWTDDVPAPPPPTTTPPTRSQPRRVAIAAAPTLHLVRRGTRARLAPGDWLVDLDRLQLADRGTSRLPPGPITHDQLVDLIAAAHRVVTW